MLLNFLIGWGIGSIVSVGFGLYDLVKGYNPKKDSLFIILGVLFIFALLSWSAVIAFILVEQNKK